MEIRKATANDYMMMSQTLAEAFSENPLFNYMLRQDHRKKRAYRELFNTAIGVMKKNNEMYVTEKIEGVALWNPPNKWGLTRLQEICYLPRFLHISGIERINRLNKVMDMMKRKRPSLPHMYLFAIGVRAERRRKGIGRRLLVHILDRCDSQRTPAYLENSSEANLHFYCANGFRVLEEVQVSSDAPKMWLMWRDPK